MSARDASSLLALLDDDDDDAVSLFGLLPLCYESLSTRSQRSLCCSSVSPYQTSSQVRKPCWKRDVQRATTTILLLLQILHHVRKLEICFQRTKARHSRDPCGKGKTIAALGCAVGGRGPASGACAPHTDFARGCGTGDHTFSTTCR